MFWSQESPFTCNRNHLWQKCMENLGRVRWQENEQEKRKLLLLTTDSKWQHEIKWIEMVWLKSHMEACLIRLECNEVRCKSPQYLILVLIILLWLFADTHHTGFLPALSTNKGARGRTVLRNETGRPHHRGSKKLRETWGSWQLKSQWNAPLVTPVGHTA